MLDVDHRVITIHPDSRLRRGLRWLVAFGFAALGASQGEILPMMLLLALVWGVWGHAVAWVIQLLLGPTHAIAVSREAVFIDGERTLRWRGDPRIAQPLVLDVDSLHGFIKLVDDEVEPPKFVAREATVGAEVWQVEDRRPEPSVRWVGWVWLVISAVALPSSAAAAAPMIAFLAGVALLVAFVVGHMTVQGLGWHQGPRQVVLRDRHLTVEGESVHLGNARIFVVETAGEGTLWAVEGERRVRIAHHEKRPIRGLARELRRVAAEVEPESGAVSPDLRALLDGVSS
ncbi:MAG: hypothetical protein EP329_15905 [Deltaproteobacteria bacterium]|nr:MAG: hypothetical protein EP329_15905 [Deltaproteobacteria bacterium]